MTKNVRLAALLLAGLATPSFAAMQLTMTANGWTRSWGGVVQGSEYPSILIGNEAISGSGYENKGIFKFSLSGLAADVDMAVLHLWIDGQQYTPNPATISRIAVGNGTSVTFADSSAAELSTAVQAFTYAASGGWATIDVAALVNAARGESASYISFRLVEKPYVAEGGHNQLYLVDSSSGTNKPYLTTPFPNRRRWACWRWGCCPCCAAGGDRDYFWAVFGGHRTSPTCPTGRTCPRSPQATRLHKA